MKCPTCQHENPEDAIFCNSCGNKLEITCPECGKSNPPGSRFCNGCGRNLTQPSEGAPKDLSFDEKIKKIQKYLP
ncbi:MAG: zinc ribbon domain-containing protein, partial [Pseudomonadota bacterium]